jgi:hypothetical protein
MITISGYPLRGIPNTLAPEEPVIFQYPVNPITVEEENLMQRRMFRRVFVSMVLLFLCVALSGCCSHCQNKEAAMPSRTMEAVSSVTATVEEIDYDLRRVILKMPDGRMLPLWVGEDAYNFDQVKAGDLVDITYSESIVVSLEKASGAQPSIMTTGRMDRAPKGQKPEGIAYKTTEVRARVVGINYENRTVDLLGLNGNVVSIEVDTKVDNFESIQKGDDVVARYTEAVAISVRPANIKPKN